MYDSAIAPPPNLKEGNRLLLIQYKFQMAQEQAYILRY